MKYKNNIFFFITKYYIKEKNKEKKIKECKILVNNVRKIVSTVNALMKSMRSNQNKFIA